MSEKRRDNKGRILREGEYQRKDGKYEYKYKNKKGQRVSVYSWRLVETDKIPAGKRDNPPLREQEKEINKDRADNIDSHEAKKFTLNTLFEQHMKEIKIRPTTEETYWCYYKKHIRDTIGMKKIADIRYTHMRDFYLDLLDGKNLSLGTVKDIHRTLNPVFKNAVRDGLIRLNPAENVLQELAKNHSKPSKKRLPLTEEQQENLIDFIFQNPKYQYYNTLFTVLLGTGCRRGEVAGLRFENCDFEKGIIYIRDNLVYCKDKTDGKKKFHMSKPKTEAGIREIPMLQAVKKALLEEKKRQMEKDSFPIEVDGLSGFVFQNKKGNLYGEATLNYTIKCIIRDFNAEEKAKAARENRKPHLLPHFSVHNLRHTFCTRFCENEKDVKIIQSIMGHAHISTTMNIYNEATTKRKLASITQLEGKIKIG